MMPPKFDAGKRNGDDSGKLLHEIEAIRKALYLEKNAQKSLHRASTTRATSDGKNRLSEPMSRSKYAKEEAPQKDKKSFWNWKPLKALSRNKRFNCCFSLQVHSIDFLPSSFNNLGICVHWKRRDGDIVTRQVKVLDGVARFEEKLTHTCSVYGSRSGSNHSAKYEAKHFLLYTSIFGASELDLGKHRVDLTRLLPLTLEELEDEKSTGTWSTSFKLTGKAKGASMHVSFGYEVVGDHTVGHAGDKRDSKVTAFEKNRQRLPEFARRSSQRDNNASIVRRTGSSSTNSNRWFHGLSQSVEDIKVLHEVLEVSKSVVSSIDLLYPKPDEDKCDATLNYRSELEVFTKQLKPLELHPSNISGFQNENCIQESKGSKSSAAEDGRELLSEVLEKPGEATPDTTHGSALGSLHDVIESGVEEAIKGKIFHSLKDDNDGYTRELHGYNSKGDETCTKESVMKDLEIALDNVLKLEKAGLESPRDEEAYQETESNYKTSKVSSLGLDDTAESVADEFLTLLGIEHSPFGLSSESEPESPRECLLREFEKEALAGRFSLFDFDDNYDSEPAVSEEENLAGHVRVASDLAAEEEHLGAIQNPRSGLRSQPMDDLETENRPRIKIWEESEAEISRPRVRVFENSESESRPRVKVLEDLETETLMHKWGFSEKAFQHSPSHSACGFGDSVYPPLEDSLPLPPLGECLGPFLQTNDGGYLRSMNPALFTNARSGGSLIMQASRPVVVPSEMGSDIMDILQCLASIGIEKLSTQANKLMPLEDITGKTMQQIAWENLPSSEAPDRLCLLEDGSKITKGRNKVLRGRSLELGPTDKVNLLSSRNGTKSSEYVSLDDLAPLAMDKIEALSMEGLRIQSSMAEEDAPSNISAQSIGDILALKGDGADLTGGSLGMGGTAGLQLLDMKTADEVDGLMGFSLTLDEWMKLDSGELGDGDQISERTSKILSAHRANSLDAVRGGSKRGKGSGRKYGLLGNNFTVALMVQLRDPLRNYDPVGTPMLALIQVERVFVPPKQKIYSTVSELRQTNDDDEVDKSELVVVQEEKKEVESPQFKITEIHVAGLETEPAGRKKLWGTKKQQQSGSRWLLANGMGKNNKFPLVKSKPVAKPNNPFTVTSLPGDTLWSISARVHGSGAKWKELAALNPHIRNPNIILRNETIRLR